MIEAKYIDLSERIAAGIKSGQWTGRLPGVVKLSRELGADPATIGKAFRVLAERGLVTVNGTRGTFIAKPGARPRHKVVGVVGIGVEKEYYSDELSAIEETLGARSYRMIGVAHKADLFVDDMGLLLRFPVDGYIFMYSSLTLPIAAFLRENGVSFVSCNKPLAIPGVNWADFDSEGALAAGLRHLIERGHRRIAYASFNNPKYAFTERMAGVYNRVMAEAGLPVDPSLLLFRDAAGYFKDCGEEYERAFGAEIGDGVGGMLDRPTAAVILGTLAARGFVDSLKSRGLLVPADMSVLVYDDRKYHDKFLSSIRFDYKDRAARAVRLLLRLLDEPGDEAASELISSVIVANKSVEEVKRP